MNINMSSIMGKVKAFSESPEGKRRIEACIEKYKKEGMRVTAAGSRVITEDEMVNASRKMVQLVQEAGRAAELPESVMNHLYGLKISPVTHRKDGSSVIYIYFSGDLHRESLEDGEGGYTGDGINNIVALFNNGAHASNFVYGWWNGHDPTGASLARTGGDLKPGYAWVRSKKDREALHFIQNAVANFNDNWGGIYNATAIAGEDYQ